LINAGVRELAGSNPVLTTNYKIYTMKSEVKKVLAMVLLENISLSDIEGYPEDVIDEVSFYLSEAFGYVVSNYLTD